MQYYGNIFVCAFYENGARKSRIIDIYMHTYTMLFCNAILKDDNLICVSKAFQKGTIILEIDNFFFCILSL